MLNRQSRLNVGVVVDSASVPMWVLEVLRDIKASSFLRLAFVAVMDARRSPTRSPYGWRKVVWSSYSIADRLLHRKERDLFRTRLIGRVIPDVPVVSLSPGERQDSLPLVFPDEQVDVIVDFTGGAPPELLPVPRSGIWEPRIGDHPPGAEPPFVRELFRGAQMTEMSLHVVRKGSERGLVIQHSFCAVMFTSPFRNANAIYGKTATFLIRGLRDLHRYGWTELEKRVALQGSTDSESTATEPSVNPVTFIGRAAAARLKRTAGAWTRHTQWRIGVRARTWRTLADRTDDGFRFLPPGDDRFHADPFVLQYRSRHYVFFEDYRYTEKKAVISFVELGERGEFGEPELALRADHHLSYPFLFESDGSIFLIPESVASRRVELYRATEFPRRWTHEATLLKDIHLADPTVIERDGKFWMFGASSLGGSDWDELFLYFASDILGPWHAHPNNPVVADVRRARPAGRLFWDSGRLIRPGQDCSVGYGYAIALNSVEKLTEEEYAESSLGSITPNRLPGAVGVHTLNHNEDFEVIDARFMLRRSFGDVSVASRRRLRRTLRLD